MNLKNYFNIKYALQNLKKSRGTLALFLGIFPIINCLILLLFYADTSVIPSILDMSILNICGLYILPIVISLCLFQFSYYLFLEIDSLCIVEFFFLIHNN